MQPTLRGLNKPIKQKNTIDTRFRICVIDGVQMKILISYWIKNIVFCVVLGTCLCIEILCWGWKKGSLHPRGYRRPSNKSVLFFFWFRFRIVFNFHINRCTYLKNLPTFCIAVYFDVGRLLLVEHWIGEAVHWYLSGTSTIDMCPLQNELTVWTH